MRRRAEPFARREFLRALRVYNNKFFDRIEGAASIDQIVQASQREFSDQFIRESYYRVYDRVGVQFAKEGLRDFKGHKWNLEKKDLADEFEYLWSKLITDFVDNKCAARIAKVTRTTYEGIVGITKQVVDEGMRDNLAIRDIARGIRREVKEMELWKALRIARTEVVTASNAGNLKGAEASGLQLNKIWVTAIDDRTRTGHMDANGQERDMHEDFDVDGERLEIPGDPGGSAENVINCRCSAVYQQK